MPDHHDHVGTYAVGNHRYHDRQDDEEQSFPQGVIGDVGIHHAERRGRNQVTHTAARLDHRPVSRGQREPQTIPVHRNAGKAQCLHGECGCEFHHRRNQVFPHWHREEQEQQRECEKLRHLPAQQAGQRSDHDTDEGELLHHLHAGQARKRPHRQAGEHEHEEHGGRLRRKRSQMPALLPQQPKRDRQDQKPVRIGLEVVPDIRHTLGRGPEQRQHDQKCRYARCKAAAPARRYRTRQINHADTSPDSLPMR